MQTQKPSPILSALRRSFALIEFAAAALFLLLALDGMTARVGGGCASLGAAMGRLLALPFLLAGVGVAFVAFKSWRSGRRWWAWHAAMLAWVVVAPALSLILLANFGD